MASVPDLYDYANFRLFLRDVFAWHRRNKNPLFLQRSIMEKLGVASTGFLSNVLAGRKNLTPAQIRRTCELLGLGESEALFFDAMVHYGQAKVGEEKSEWFDRMTRLQTVRLRPLDSEKMSLFSRPEMVFLFEWLTFSEFDGDFEKLGQRFDPPFSAKEVQSALKALQNMGLLVLDRKGVLRTCDNAITSGQDVQSQDLVRFHQRTMALARRSLSKVTQKERDLSVLTLGLSEDGFIQVKNELANFRRRLVALALQETSPSRLFQLNFHVFPVTREKT